MPENNSGLTVEWDLTPLAAATVRTAAALQELQAQLVAAAYEVSRFVEAMAEALSRPSMTRYAVERMGVTEADVRWADWWTGEVVLWNRRRLHADRDDMAAWAAER